MWKEGNMTINGNIFHYWIKINETDSEWGIDGGKICKLLLKWSEEIVANYDGKWKIKSSDLSVELAIQLLIQNEN